MNFSRKTILLLALIIFTSSLPIGKGDWLEARQNNVCKFLKDDVLLYFIFIDTRTTHPWTEFDILTTIDSIHVAKRWIEKEAAEANIPLNIKTDYYIGNEYTTINRSLPKSTVSESVLEPNPAKAELALNRWGDFVAKIVGNSLYLKDKDGIPAVRQPGNKERLIAHLRDEYAVESVALMFFVNNYFREDISVTLNTTRNDDVEFAIVSYKYPSEIAHYLVKLFGGVDLYRSIDQKNRRTISYAEKYFPDDIMQNVEDRDIRELNIGEFTSYMIGWKDELDPKYEPLLRSGFLR